MPIRINEALPQLLTIVSQLQETYRPKAFTLDGRLVGDIGEVLVAEVYDIELFGKVEPHHDGSSSDGRNVQIKATLKDSLSFPVDHVPEYYIGIKIRNDGTFDTIFNGPGTIIAEKVKQYKKPEKYNFYNLSLNTLQELDRSVLPLDRIPKRAAR